MSQLRGSLVTTAWVLTELADGLAGQSTRGTFITLERRLRGDPRMVIVECGAELHNRGLELYRSRPDKNWSLSDCISFVVMADRGINAALTADHHFEQAGFNALLKT
jgi:predicted nucleic acid-binding protein